MKKDTPWLLKHPGWHHQSSLPPKRCLQETSSSHSCPTPNHLLLLIPGSSHGRSWGTYEIPPSLINEEEYKRRCRVQRKRGGGTSRRVLREILQNNNGAHGLDYAQDTQGTQGTQGTQETQRTHETQKTQEWLVCFIVAIVIVY